MKVCFVSNYINHHQIPFCNAMCRETEGQFTFIQTEPMEKERVQMGWQENGAPEYVHRFYEEEEWCRREILECDVLLFGGCDDESYIQERLLAGRLIIRISERLYKTGQWKAVSPRGLLKKYKDHTRYRKAPVYLLCAGAYVASDFHIVKAYPGKMFCWGYFPETKYYDIEDLLAGKGYLVGASEEGKAEELENHSDERKIAVRRIPYILWAGRFIDWKHPERALEAAKYLKEQGLDFRMELVGGGPLEEEVRSLISVYGLEEQVILPGYCAPALVREKMERADIFLMTSDRQEGWGAVANEAMNSGCVLVANHMAGAIPYLVRQGENGYLYEEGNQEMINSILKQLILDERQCQVLGRRAYRTIIEVWNAENAAGELMKLIDRIVDELSGNPKKDSLVHDETASGAGCAKRQGAFMNRRDHALVLAPCVPAPIISEKRPVPMPVFVGESVGEETCEGLVGHTGERAKGCCEEFPGEDVAKDKGFSKGEETTVEEQPLLSIIVPVYNTKEYLRRCVDSITAQTYKNLEILLVNDGSTDGSGQLCDELAAGDQRIRVLHKENGGSSSARNLAIREAKGEYLAFVDSDDYISSEMYEDLWRGIAKYGVKIAQIGRDEVDPSGELLPNICEPPEEDIFYNAEDFLRELLMHRGDCSFCTKLVHKSLFEGRCFPEGLLNEDFRLLVQMLPQAGGVLSLPGQTYHVFYRLGSNSRKENKEHFSRVYGDCVDNADLAAKLVKKDYPALEKVALRFGVFQRLEYLLHIPIGQMTKVNQQYRSIVKWLRKNWFAGMCNPYLTKKNKCYQTLFVLAPKGIRVVHGKVKGL